MDEYTMIEEYKRGQEDCNEKWKETTQRIIQRIREKDSKNHFLFSDDLLREMISIVEEETGINK